MQQARLRRMTRARVRGRLALISSLSGTIGDGVAWARVRRLRRLEMVVRASSTTTGKREREEDRGERKGKEETKREEIFLDLYGFSKPDFILPSVFRN